MPLLRPSPSDYTTVVKALANAGAAVTNPQGYRPPSKGSVAFVNVSSVAALIRGSRFSLIQPRVALVPAASAPAAEISLANAGASDAFVVKYNSAGTPLWARKIGGTGTEINYGVASDSDGNIIVAGYFTSSTGIIYNTDGTTTFATFTIAGGSDGFVVKYNSSGEPQWARQIAGTGNEFLYSLATDSDGNIVVAGTYQNNPVSIFGSSASFATLANAGGIDVFIVKYNSSGTPQWVRRITPSDVRAIATDSTGNIVVAGYFTSTTLTISGSSSSLSLNRIGGTDAFITQYNSSGEPQWVRRIGGTGSELSYAVATDSTGNIVVAGLFSSSTITISGSSSSLSLNNIGGNDAFITQYNSSGEPQWARQIAGTGSDQVNSVAIDSNGNIVVIGNYQSNPVSIFGSSASFATLANANTLSDTFVVKYNSSGTPQWARRIGGIGREYGVSVVTDSTGNIIVTGFYNSTELTIYGTNETPEFTLTNADDDIFIVKYNSSGIPQWAKRIGGSGGEYTQFTNSVSTDSTGNIIVAGQYYSNPLTIT
jgi:uncharacterized delta-60 repeat protein